MRERSRLDTAVLTTTALPLLALALAACSSGPTGPAPAAQTTGSFTSRMSSMFFGDKPAQASQASGPVDQPECPTVDVRQGASTITVRGPGEPVATNVRYQATIGQMARECAVLGATMTIKVGVQGRIIIGPLGGPGKIDVPMRIALVHEGPEPRTLWTKLYRVPVTIPASQTNVPFVHVEEDLTVPNPKADDVESYIIYVGFDEAPQREQRPQRTRRSG